MSLSSDHFSKMKHGVMHQGTSTQKCEMISHVVQAKKPTEVIVVHGPSLTKEESSLAVKPTREFNAAAECTDWFIAFTAGRGQKGAWPEDCGTLLILWGADETNRENLSHLLGMTGYSKGVIHCLFFVQDLWLIHWQIRASISTAVVFHPFSSRDINLAPTEGTSKSGEQGPDCKQEKEGKAAAEEGIELRLSLGAEPMDLLSEMMLRDYRCIDRVAQLVKDGINKVKSLYCHLSFSMLKYDGNCRFELLD